MRTYCRRVNMREGIYMCVCIYVRVWVYVFMYVCIYHKKLSTHVEN